MNEKDIERRLRSVVSGPAPAAPSSLRGFLRELPETEARRRRGPLGALRGVIGAIPSLAPGMTIGRKLQVAGAVSLAIVLSIAGAGLLISLRQIQRQPSSSQSPTPVPTQMITPRRTTPDLSVVPLKVADNPYWYLTTQYGNDDAALPVVTAARSDGTYLGLSAPPYGMNGVLRSEKGLFWDWSPISEVDSDLSELTSIAADTTGRMVVVGWATGPGGVKDGRAYLSDDGYTWTPAANQSVFAGIVVRTVVHGPRGFVALGWNDGSPADSIRPIVEWFSGDGVTWTRISGVPAQGTSAFLMATAAGYVLSGSPLKTGNVDQPPFWYSVDGTSWQRATATDNTAQKLGPLVSLTLVGGGTLIGLSGLSDGMSTQLVESSDGGRTWRTLTPQGPQNPNGFTHIASLGTGSAWPSDMQWLIATYSKATYELDGARLYVSADGRTWKEAVGDKGGSPLGTMLVEVGPGYGTAYRRVLAFGQPSERLNISLASAAEIAWP